MATQSANPEPIQHFVRSSDRRRNSYVGNINKVNETLTAEIKPDQEGNQQPNPNLRSTHDVSTALSKRISQKSRSHARLDIFKPFRNSSAETKPDYIAFTNLKNNYFKSEVVSAHHSLVTKEMLTRSIALHDAEDRNVVINILKKKPQQRNKEEIMFTQEALKNIKFFTQIENELDPASFTSLFQNLCLERFSPGQRVFNHGDVARKFYIIIQGSVYILFKNDGLVVQEKKSPRKHKQEEVTDNLDKLQKLLKMTTSEEERKKRIETFNPGFWIARTTDKGESFGEIGLQKSDERLRTATVVCREETLVGVWSYEDYDAVFAKIYEARYKEKINFLEKVDAFGHWTPNHISAFAYHVEESKVPRNKVILKQGDVSNHLYFIKSGEIELRKYTNLPEDERAEILNTLEDKEKYSRNSALKSKRPEAIKLGRIVQGDYFGISASLEKKPSEFTAIVASGEAVLITITIYKFVRFVKDRVTLDKLKEHIARRDTFHESMTSNFININTLFATKAWTEQQSSPLESPLALKKNASAHTMERVRIENPPSVIIKSSSQPREGSADSAAGRSTRPRTVSGGNLPINQNIESKRFFATNPNPKVSKFGVAYERHQIRLKKLFGERSDRDEKAEKTEKSQRIEKTLKTEKDERVGRPKQGSSLKTTQDLSPESLIKDTRYDLIGRTPHRLITRLTSANPSYRSSSERLSIYTAINTATEEGPLLTPQPSPGIKLVNMPLKVKPLMSPQLEHMKKHSVFSFNEESINSSTRQSVNLGNDSFVKGEEVLCTDKQNFVQRKVIKRNLSQTPGREGKTTMVPKILSSFSKKV